MKSTREQWLLDRKTGLGGSDIAAIMGLSPWRTPLDVYLDKIDPDFIAEDKPCLSRGRKLEKYVLEEYSEQNHVELETDLGLVRDKEYQFLFGTIDAKVKDKNTIVEAKSCSGSSSKWHGDIPLYYKAQVAHYASLFDADYVDVAVLFDRFEYAQFTYFRETDFEKKIKDAAIEFWHKHILAKNPPALQDKEDIKKMHRQATNKPLVANEKLITSVDELRKLKCQKKMIEDKINQIEVAIMSEMQDSESLEDGFGNSLILLRNSTRRSFDSTSFKLEHADLYEKYNKITQTRTFKLC